MRGLRFPWQGDEPELRVRGFFGGTRIELTPQLSLEPTRRFLEQLESAHRTVICFRPELLRAIAR